MGDEHVSGKIFIFIFTHSLGKISISFNYECRKHIIVVLAVPIDKVTGISHHITVLADLSKYHLYSSLL